MADEELPAHGRTPNRSRYTAVELAKALAWPVIVALLLVSFWTPLHTLVDTIPQLLFRPEEFSIGGVKFHLRKSLIDQASPEEKRILNDLGPAEVELILEVKPGDVVCSGNPPTPEERQPFIVLVEHHLFEWVTKEEAKQQESQGYPCGFGVRTTPMFRRVREFMINAILEAIQQSKTLPASKPSTITKTGAATR